MFWYRAASPQWHFGGQGPQPTRRALARLSQAVLPVVLGALCCVRPFPATGQEQADTKTASHTPASSAPSTDDLAPSTAKVEVTPAARDEEVRARLENVFAATGWFTDTHIDVKQGVVFLNGKTDTEELKTWAGELARNTQAVVAVANRIQVHEPSAWDLRPAWSELLALWRDFIRSLPVLIFALLILAMSLGAGMLVVRGVRSFLRPRLRARLLRNVIARGAGGLTILAGLYIVLRVAGLTQLALTVIGGTGLLGLVLGIAFRDISENFLASIFLSMQRPFETGDLVEISDVTGYVQQLNLRTTILMTLSGNVVHIPNAAVYKMNVRNFTTSCKRREDFGVGIGYNDSINAAQEVARRVLANHPAVLGDPEPWVLADSLGQSTVNLRVYFWIDGRAHSWLKVRSSVIRLVKLAFQSNGISMPDEAREVIFPQGVPVTVLDRLSEEGPEVRPEHPLAGEAPHEDVDAAYSKAEGGLESDAGAIEKQAQQVAPLKDGENLLPRPDGTPSPRTTDLTT